MRHVSWLRAPCALNAFRLNAETVYVMQADLANKLV